MVSNMTGFQGKRNQEATSAYLALRRRRKSFSAPGADISETELGVRDTVAAGEDSRIEM